MIELRQDLTGSSAILATSERCINPCSFRQHNRELEFGGVHPLIGGLTEMNNMNLVSWSLKCLSLIKVIGDIQMAEQLHS